MIWDLLGGLLSSDTGPAHQIYDVTVINPATGLPMLDNSVGGVDVCGSPFGFDTHSVVDGTGSCTGSNLWD